MPDDPDLRPDAIGLEEKLAMARLVAASRRIAALRAPLGRHPRLDLELACALYCWVGEVLKTEIAARFPIDAAAFDRALAAARSNALSGAPEPTWRAAGDNAEQREMQTRLIAKLDAAGQLRPGFLLRALREGNLHLFQEALACLAGVKADEVRRALASDRPELLALACVGIGLDRSVFPTILTLTQELNQGRPAAHGGSATAIAAAFALGAGGEAIVAFRQGARTLPPDNGPV